MQAAQCALAHLGVRGWGDDAGHGTAVLESREARERFSGGFGAWLSAVEAVAGSEKRPEAKGRGNDHRCSDQSREGVARLDALKSATH
jgi:hypothetical protein